MATLRQPVWREVTAAEPCAVCGAAARCGRDRDDPELVRCGRTASALPLPGGGWVHVVPGPRATRAPVSRPP
jgi:hypothetical protein